MDAVNPLFSVVVILIALFTCFLLAAKGGIPIAHERFQSIDGLLGYLALFVFIHHSSIWYFYLRSGEWKVPPSNLFTDFGIVGVALFFMITGFLFFSKLLKGRSEKIDWERLFVSRILRLMPLYLLIVGGIVVIVFVSSHGALVGSRRNLLSGIWQWVILGTPDLNGISRTSLIVAAVTWSLRYEWFFYLALPLIALLVGVIAPLPYLALSCASLYFLPQWWELKDYHEMFFLGGIVASLLVRSTIFCKIARTSVSSLVIVLCLVSIVSFCSPAYDLCILLLLSLVFALIAGGNDLFGLLTQPFSRLLGEMSYSVYLLHGMFLYVLFNFIVGCNYAKSVTPFVYWLLIDCSVPFLIVLSYLIFRFVELPPMKLTFQVSNWLQKRTKFELPKGSWR